MLDYHFHHGDLRLQDAVDLAAVQDDLAGIVHQALEPALVSVWISQRG